jgi:transcriptional regulator with XRE-family HTH domain
MSRSQTIHRFGEKLHALRIQRGLTLQELAAKLGYTAHGHLSELEAGKKLPTVEFVIKAARLFKVTTDVLLFDELDLES